MRVIKLKGVKRINGLHYAPDGRLLVVSGPHPGQVSDLIRIDAMTGERVGGISATAKAYTQTPDRSKLILGCHEFCLNQSQGPPPRVAGPRARWDNCSARTARQWERRTLDARCRM